MYIKLRLKLTRPGISRCRKPELGLTTAYREHTEITEWKRMVSLPSMTYDAKIR